MESQIRRPVWRIFGNWEPLDCFRRGQNAGIVKQ